VIPRFLGQSENRNKDTKLFKKKIGCSLHKNSNEHGEEKDFFFSLAKCAHRNQFSTQHSLKNPTPSETII
jgi:hypothetical protein